MNTTTQETAKRYGVPTPETCKELNWQNETYFYWCEIDNCEYQLCFKTRSSIEGMYCKINSILGLFPTTVIPAPQMHEIAGHLPEKWTLDSYANQLHFENYIGNEPVFLTYIQNHQNNYAEAYAQLFLRLRKECLV
jgi:hypothetical protein